MRPGGKNEPHFSRKELGFLFALISVAAFLAVPSVYGGSYIINIPEPLPDIVKNYKSITLYAQTIGMFNTGVWVQPGDYITILAKGLIDVWPSWNPGAKTPDGRMPITDTGNFVRGPKKILIFRLNEKVGIRNYRGPELIQIKERGTIYLGYKDGDVDLSGNPLRPQDYKDNIGALFLDIIVWNTKDPKLIAKFLGKASSAKPNDVVLKRIVQEFRQNLGLREETNDNLASPVIKMPKPFPDIVKNYKSVTAEAGVLGIHDTGFQIKKGDCFTIVAKGKINLWPGRGQLNIYGPKGLLLFRLKENDRVKEYIGPELMEAKENGAVYLGYRGWRVNPEGKPFDPENFKIHAGTLSVDLIVWKRKDPKRIIKFFEQACLWQPDDNDLREIAQEFKKELGGVHSGKNIEENLKARDLPNSTRPIIKMPASPPEIVKSYKSVTLQAKMAGMHNTGLQVKQGDFLTILAEGTVNVAPGEENEPLREPKSRLLYRFGNKEFVRGFRGPGVVEASDDGAVYLGYVGSLIYFSGEPVRPEYYEDDLGGYTVDIIVWKRSDLLAILKFLDEASLAQPENKQLREMVEDFKTRKEVLSALEKSLIEKERKEAELRSQLERLEAKVRQPNVLPAIAVASPRDGIKVQSEYIYLVGVAEHEKGISKLEILVNSKIIDRRDSRNLKLVQKAPKRIEFSERIRLQEGKNTISLLAQSIEGLESRKTLSVELERKREEVYAVVIGINNYKNLPSLKYAAKDAQEFYRYLVKVSQIPKDHVWLLLDELATLDKLRSTLGTLLRQSAGKDDTVIIFWAGHGATEADTSSPDGDGLEKYILPHNADSKDLYASAMPMSEIARIFQRISSERLVFISDTCYSGASGGRTIVRTETRANVSGAYMERLLQGKGRVILTASDANELSIEKDELKHGVFTYYLLEGLRGKADLDGDGMVTVDEVYRYVSTKVPLATSQRQHPVRKGEITGQIILGVVK